MAGHDQPPPSVFISYSHDSPEHVDRVLKLADRLRLDGIDAILDQYETSPPEAWPRWMDRQIRDADFVLMVCTETYYRRVMDEEEPGRGLGVRWEGHLIYQHIYNAGTKNTRFIPVLFKSGKVEHIPTPLQGATHYWVDTEEGYEGLYRRLTGQPAVEKPELGKLRSLPAKNRKQDFFAPPWNVPYQQNPFFTGREKDLKELRRRLVKESKAALSQAQAICGLGGIGKTQIAVEYAYRHRKQYAAVFWVRADTHSALIGGFVEIARSLGLPEQDAEDQSLAVEAVKRWLEQHADWLLIFDNADHPELIRPFCPQDFKGHVVLTSRASVFDCLGITRPIAVDELPPVEARQFLIRRTGKKSAGAGERKAADQLAEQLGYLPLALEQAGAYILAKRCSFEDYLVSYRRRRTDLLKQSGPRAGNYPESVATTWSINFAEVEAAGEAPADLLRACAFFDPDEIPLELVTLGASELGPAVGAALADVDDDPVRLHDVLAPLTCYSLVGHDPDLRTVSVHRLVQEVLKDGMDLETRRLWAERTVRAVNEAFPIPEFSNWPLCERLLPQAKAAAKLVEDWGFAFANAGRLLGVTASYLHHRARYAEAEPLYQRALAITEKALGPEHADVAATLNNLAGLYQDQGKYAEAQPLYQRALDIMEKALGPEHPDMGVTLGNLALLYKTQGNYAEAEPLYQQALAIKEKALGPEHPNMAVTLNNLALLYVDQGKYAEAEPLYERALEITEKALGPEHPSVATTLNNLAELYRAQGKYTEAEPLYERALAITEKALGPEQPRVAVTLNNLAGLYRDQRKYAEAEPLYQRALAIKEKALGSEHPSVATTLNNLALLYNAQGKHAEAEPLYQRALAIREKALGPEHPDTAKFLENYAGLLRATERGDEAAKLAARAKAIRDKNAE